MVSGANGYFVGSVTSTSNVDQFLFFTASGKAGFIRTNGTTCTYNSVSDETMKRWEDVPQTNYRAAIQQMWVGDYAWKGDNKLGFGVRAQQVNSLLPDFRGVSSPIKEDDKWSASSEPFGFLALWGVKDLYKIIDDLTTRLAALENK